MSKKTGPSKGAVHRSQTLRLPAAGLASPADSVALTVVVENPAVGALGEVMIVSGKATSSLVGGSTAGSRNPRVNGPGGRWLALPEVK